jgi:Fur family zinc uptake transcriptional regulator
MHRLTSLNAYIGCCSPSQHHQSHFFICRLCDSAVELVTPSISEAIAQSAEVTGFAVEAECVEVVGLCPQCQNPQPPPESHRDE